MGSAEFGTQWNKTKTKTDKTVEQVDFEASNLATWDKEGTVSGHRKVKWHGNGEGSLTPETQAGQPEEPYRRASETSVLSF